MLLSSASDDTLSRRSSQPRALASRVHHCKIHRPKIKITLLYFYFLKHFSTTFPVADGSTALLYTIEQLKSVYTLTSMGRVSLITRLLRGLWTTIGQRLGRQCFPMSAICMMHSGQSTVQTLNSRTSRLDDC